MSSDIELTVTAGTAKFDPEDPRWLDEVATLNVALRKEVGTLSLRGVPESGAKGAVEAVTLALGSSGALTAAVACFRAWLARDKTRTLTVTWTDDQGAEQTLTVTGDHVDQASFQALAEAAGRRLGGS
ncbi:effector-associated constant component EACC1 [Streptomyces sp. 8N616]|uniref:effector-associated constant component EACC1 n=1 Tax=Streptomyces sp. 8N616 TaxID=3457414 RepID=UPI003FD5AD47